MIMIIITIIRKITEQVDKSNAKGHIQYTKLVKSNFNVSWLLMHRMLNKVWLQTITFYETWCKQTCSSEIASFHLLSIDFGFDNWFWKTDLPASCPFLVLYLLQGWKMPADTNSLMGLYVI